MRVRQRKRARSTAQRCASLAMIVVVTCVLVCPFYRAVMDSLIVEISEIATTPHSLEHQLLRSKNSTPTASAVSRVDAAVRVANRQEGEPDSAQQKEEQQHNNDPANMNTKISLEENKGTSQSNHENQKESNGDVPKPTRESRKNHEPHDTARDITLLRKTAQELAMNSSLRTIELSKERDDRRHKELEEIVDKLRLKISANNSSVSVRHEPAPTFGSDEPVPAGKSVTNDTAIESRKPQEAHRTANSQKVVESSHPAHYPTFLSEHALLSSLKRRMNLLTPYTGCSIAAHQYNLGKHAHPEFNDCFVHCGKPFAKTRGIRVDNAAELVKENDTIFVQFNKLFHFVNKTMDLIDVDFVLISGNEQKVPPIEKQDFDAIVNNPRVIHWFMSNMDIYSHDLNHPKISPWPYGSNPKKLAYLANELRSDQPERTHSIHLSGFSRATNPQRYHIPSGPQVPIEQYLKDFRSSYYVISPDGDRPECYRHYEAIAMGCMPITQMDAKTHSHLSGQVVFNNTNWNLTSLALSLPANPKVNQRLIFEEYWMEYVERIVGRPLRWYDPSRDVHSSLKEIQNLVANDIVEPREEMCVVANGVPFVGHRAPPEDAYKIS